MNKHTTPEIGQEILAVTLEAINAHEWRAQTNALPEGWNALVRSRGQEVPPEGLTSYWIFGLDHRKRTAYLS